MADYRIVRTAPDIYTGKDGRPITGFQVEVLLIDFDEQHTLQVPTLDLEVVKEGAEKLLDNRRKLAELG